MSKDATLSQGRLAVYSGLLFLLGLCFLQCAEPAYPEDNYAPGDTLGVLFTAVDSAGNVFDADSAKVVVARFGSRVDSFGYGGSAPGKTGMTKLSGTTGRYTYAYVVPSTWGSSNPYDLRFLPFLWGEGYAAEFTLIQPSGIRINEPINTASFYSAQATATTAVIDTTSCTPCGAYYGGNGVTDALVYITSGPVYSPSSVVGFTLSVAGDWRVRVPTVPGVPDTFYVHIYRQNAFSPSATRVIVSE